MRLMVLPLLLALTAAAPAGTVSFQVVDETDPAEISEDTVIFMNGHQVAHFVLDKHHPTITADISLPGATQYDYALCGRITLAKLDGSQEERVVDGGATLKAVDGHLFRALAAGDFTIFYLSDVKQDPPSVPGDAHHTDACSLPVS